MTITGPIPLPNTGMSEFLKQLQLGQQNRFKSQELNQNRDYQQGILSIHKSAEERAKTTLPLLMQQYEDIHGAAMTAKQKNATLMKLIQDDINRRGGRQASRQNDFMPQESNPQLPESNQAPSMAGETPVAGGPDEPGIHPIAAPNSPYRKLEQEGLVPGNQPAQEQMQAPNNDNQRQQEAENILGGNNQSSMSPAVAEMVKKETGYDAYAQSPMDKALTAEDAKQVGEWGKQIDAGHAIQGNLNQIQEIITSPAIASTKNNPLYFGKDIAWYKTNGTPEQQKAIGELTAANKSMYTDMSQKFKGSFRSGEQTLVEDMLINEKDTLPRMLGKMQAMQQMNKLMVKRLSLADNFARTRHVTPAKALEAADVLVDSKRIREDVKKSLEASTDAQKYAPRKGFTWIKSPSGKIHSIPNAEVPVALINKGQLYNAGGNNG